MKKNQFQEKVRKEILWVSFAGIFLMTLLVSVILAFYNRGMMEYRLQEEEAKIATSLTQTIETYDEELFVGRASSFVGFLTHQMERNKLYASVYSFQSNQLLKSDVFLFDKEGALQFTTDEPLGKNQAFLNYMNIVMNHTNHESENMSQKVYRDRTNENYLILLKPVTNKNRTIGYAAALLNSKEVTAYHQNSLVQYVVFDKHRNVFSTNSPLFVDRFSNKVSPQIMQPRITEEDNVYSVLQEPLNDSLSVAVYQKTNSYIGFLIGSLSILFLIGLLLAIQAYYFSKRISENTGKSVALLTKEMGKVQKNPERRLKVHTKDEFEEVSVTINHMLDELEELHSRNLELAQLNMETEKKKLEAQFNPHFLYNTLETIRASLYIDPSLANALILELNDILRYSIDERQVTVSLEADLYYIRQYLDIHRKRFDSFSYTIKMDDEARNVIVPKLFLLPLIENSLKYGFKHRRDLHVTLSIKSLSNEKTFIEVKDNGHALTLEACKQLNEDLKGTHSNGNHHGIWNSKKRVLFLYPRSEFVLRVEKEETVVRIVLVHSAQ